ncbi:MAG: alpha/beta hydrolase [Planctomycetes bacterium]|nr:alpha/beta hydrolase [Planctomycetota bacterium]
MVMNIVAILIGILSAAPSTKPVGPEPEPAQGAVLAREFLATRDASRRQQIAQRLATYDSAIEAVLAKLRQQEHTKTETGYRPREHFSTAALRKRHPNDLLYFTVPESYKPQQSTGLIVFMHGGGRTTSRRAPAVFMDFPEPDGPKIDMAFGDVFAASEMIAVGPSAPWDESTPYRWCVEEADAYLADVILECKSRFNIDPDRVVLMGHSMGGFGAFHQIQRSPDRYAAVISSSGAWSLGYLPTLRGTPICFLNGVHDARPGVRWHYTDVEYGRQTHTLLTALNLDHQYIEHDGKHSIGYNRRQIVDYLSSIRRTRRDPYYPHIALATPTGFRSDHRFAVTDNRWLTLNEAEPGEIRYDELRSNGADDFDDWRLTHRTTKRHGAAIEAVNEGNNRITLTTHNVRRLTIWLHPRMIDVKQPVQIGVNGRMLKSVPVQMSLATALESYERRQDWGLIYPAKVDIVVPK